MDKKNFMKQESLKNSKNLKYGLITAAVLVGILLIYLLVQGAEPITKDKVSDDPFRDVSVQDSPVIIDIEETKYQLTYEENQQTTNHPYAIIFLDNIIKFQNRRGGPVTLMVQFDEKPAESYTMDTENSGNNWFKTFDPGEKFPTNVTFWIQGEDDLKGKIQVIK